MDLIKELQEIYDSPACETDFPIGSLFWELIEIALKMAKRIEALEQREHSHPLGVGSCVHRRLDV